MRQLRENATHFCKRQPALTNCWARQLSGCATKKMERGRIFRIQLCACYRNSVEISPQVLSFMQLAVNNRKQIAISRSAAMRPRHRHLTSAVDRSAGIVRRRQNHHKSIKNAFAHPREFTPREWAWEVWVREICPRRRIACGYRGCTDSCDHAADVQVSSKQHLREHISMGSPMPAQKNSRRLVLICRTRGTLPRCREHAGRSQSPIKLRGPVYCNRSFTSPRYSASSSIGLSRKTLLAPGIFTLRVSVDLGSVKRSRCFRLGYGRTDLVGKSL